MTHPIKSALAITLFCASYSVSSPLPPSSETEKKWLRTDPIVAPNIVASVAQPKFQCTVAPTHGPAWQVSSYAKNAPSPNAATCIHGSPSDCSQLPEPVITIGVARRQHAANKSKRIVFITSAPIPDVNRIIEVGVFEKGYLMGKTYTRGPCFICGQRISNGGLGNSSHMRMHIRKGEVVAVVVKPRTDCWYSNFYRSSDRDVAERQVRSINASGVTAHIADDRYLLRKRGLY